MTNVLNNRDLRDTNSSAITSIYRAFRRRPWKTWAASSSILNAWNRARQVLQIAGFAGLLAVLVLPAQAQLRKYEALNAKVPFEFTVGSKTFNAGNYQLVITGNGMLVLRDSQAHVVAAMFAHNVEARNPVVESKLVFHMHGGRQQLRQVWIENHSQGLEIVGEEVAMRTPTLAPELPLGVMSLFERRSAPGLKF